MPKINVYISDKLEEAVRRYEIQISAVCQVALEQEVRSKLPIMKMTPAARQIFDLAEKEAEQRNHDYIGVEHLLLGILNQEYTMPSKILREGGVAESIRDRLRGIMESDGYKRGTNLVINKHGSVVGLMVQDEEGNAHVVDFEGNPITGSSSRPSKDSQESKNKG